jgi:hypothetical protein
MAGCGGKGQQRAKGKRRHSVKCGGGAGLDSFGEHKQRIKELGTVSNNRIDEVRWRIEDCLSLMIGE